MKTAKIPKLLEGITMYEVLESDETGLIPKEAGYVMIGDDENHLLDFFQFCPKIRHPGLDIGDDLDKGETRNYKRMCKKYDKAYKRFIKRMSRHQRTREEVIQIVEKLESAAVD